MNPIEQGAEFSLEVPITEQMVTDFVQLSGDNAPLHTDLEYARAKGFDGKLVHGALLFSLISRFVGVHFPGPKSLWIKADAKFPAPCYAPDTLTIHGKIAQVSEATSSIVVDISVTNSKKVTLLVVKSFHKIL